MANGQYPGTDGENSPITSPGDGPQAIYINAKTQDGVETNQLQSADPLTTVAGSTTYTLTVAVGLRQDYPFFGVEHLVLLVNGTPAATSADITQASLTAGAFTDFTTSFTTTAFDPLIGGDLKVLLQQTATTPSNQQVNFDNVRLDATAVPEPASLAVLGIASLVGLRRRRRA